MKERIHILIIGIIILFSSCTSKNLMKFYYPINTKPQIKIYQYINPENNDLNEFWKITTTPSEKRLLTESYNSDFELYNTFEELVYDENAELINYIEYEGKYIKREVKSKINKNQIYSSNKSAPYYYQIEYLGEFGKFIFEKKRKFLKFEKIKIRGKEYKTAKFKDEYFMNYPDINEKYEYYQFAYYAEKIGMVKYERYLPEGKIRILELGKILTQEEFERIKKEASK